jgi:MoaA/NifB/PqqE/SkfB family radical SAM enzyme
MSKDHRIQILKLYNHIRYIFRKKNKNSDGKYHPVASSLLKIFNKNRPFGPMPKFCYIPYNNIFFNTAGQAIVCCRNTKMVLGTYPENTIHDIWFGNKIKELRDYIKHDDLTSGCFYCLDSVKKGNFNSMTSTAFDKYGILPRSKYPRVLEFELSNKCNLECVMCSGRVSSTIRNKRENLSPLQMPYDCGFVDQLNEFIPHLKEAKFYGGEPFLIDIYYEIWERILHIKPSLKIFIQTNGTVLNEKTKYILEKGNFNISISIDSVIKENYEYIRKNASFEQVIENLEWFIENARKKSTYLGLIATPSKFNCFEIPQIVNFCNKRNLWFNISPLVSPPEMALWNKSKDEIKELIDFYSNQIFDNTSEVYSYNIATFGQLITSLEYWLKKITDNPNFAEHYKETILEQGREKEPMPRPITLSELQILADIFWKNLENFLLDKDQSMVGKNNFISYKQKIEELILKVDQSDSLIYLKLNQLNLEEIIEAIDTKNNAELLQYALHYKTDAEKMFYIKK